MAAKKLKEHRCEAMTLRGQQCKLGAVEKVDGRWCCRMHAHYYKRWVRSDLT